MKKLTILITVILTLTFCKGPNSGPLVKESFDKNDNEQVLQGQQSPGPVQTEKINLNIQPEGGSISISDLLENKKSYSGKSIKVIAYVTKYNPAIMGKNWVHIQDGTDFEGTYDLTVTTSQMVEVGETLTFEGTLALDKDFGYGYKYSVLLEDAVIQE